MSINIDMLRSISLFRCLSHDILAEIAKMSIRRHYAPREIIILEGEACQTVYFVLNGHVRVYRLSAGGREQILTELKAGGTFNVVPAFLPNCSNQATVQATAPVELCVIPTEEFRRLTCQCPDLAAAMLTEFAARLRELTDLVDDLSLHSVRSRLAQFLLEQADRNEMAQAWTQDDIAAHIGTVRDVVGRNLRGFAAAGLIRMDRQRIVLIDRSGLEKEAEL